MASPITLIEDIKDLSGGIETTSTLENVSQSHDRNSAPKKERQDKASVSDDSECDEERKLLCQPETNDGANDKLSTPTSSIEKEDQPANTEHENESKSVRKKDSFKSRLKKKASIDLDWSVFKFSSIDGPFGSRKQSMDLDDPPPPPTTAPPRSTKGSFDLGRVALRFTKRSSSDRGYEEPLEEDPPPPQLTEEQKIIIKETWKTIEANVAKVGVVMFIKLFETHPDVQDAFVPYRGMDTKNLEESRKLRNHALRVMGFVQKAVSRLDQPDKLIPLVETCGRNHCNYGASPQHIDLVGPQFIEAIQPALKDEWTPEMGAAWTLLMENVAYLMKRAMRREEKR